MDPNRFKKALEDLFKISKPTTCKHPSLFFDKGGFHIICKACDMVWQATQPPHNIMPDYTQMAGTLSVNDERRDPLYVPPLPKPEQK